MSVDIILVSKLCSGIMDIRTVPLDVDNYLMPFKDFEDILYDNYGPKYDRKIFWRYSAELYFEITNYLSFIGALNMAAENRIYVLLKDYTEPWLDNGTFIKIIDYLEDKAARRAHMDPYDVHIIQPHEVDSDQIDTELYEKSQEMTENRTDMDIIAYASRNVKQYSYYTEDFSTQSMLIKALRRVITASFLCLTNILGMKGEIISCPHKDIYFLETNTKSESTDLANMFASPPTSTGSRGQILKCKPRTKLKHKYNSALDFFIEGNATSKSAVGQQHNSSGSGSAGGGVKEEIGVSGSQSERIPHGHGGGLACGMGGGGSSRRNSIDLYEEAATILGLTCSQTDDCKCIECQCHYFDFEEEMDFAPITATSLEASYMHGEIGGGYSGEYYVDHHNSSCSIQ